MARDPSVARVKEPCCALKDFCRPPEGYSTSGSPTPPFQSTIKGIVLIPEGIMPPSVGTRPPSEGQMPTSEDTMLPGEDPLLSKCAYN